MAVKVNKVDKTRASRDGHEFHENWAARKALQLLWPQDDLIGITLEGLHPADQKEASSETVEIADVTLYYGKRPTFKGSNKVVIAQLKYSISDAQTPFRNSHAKKTIKKFADAYKNYKNTYKVKETNEKLEFELVTNRPIYPALGQAVQSIADGKPLTGEVKKQADQFIKTCGFSGKELIEFAQRVSFSGLAGSLNDNKRGLSRTLADWSGARDHMSRAHLGSMKQLLRDKAGSEGERNNLIKLIDVLGVLEVDEDALFPCPESFPEVGEVVEREHLPEAINLIAQTNKPFLIHASGGVGKTVFLQSIAKHYDREHEVILFDCFGGGAYRAPEDVRHQPKRAFTHIANKLACKGLCDPLIPTHENTADLVKTFRRRLTQASETLQRTSPNKKLMIFIDAIDNAADFAQERKEDCFSKELLKSIEYNQNIPNITIVLSCRTERRELAKDDLSCEEYKLGPFSLKETQIYLKARVRKLTSTEIEVAHARSGGNPRVLEHLALSDRGLLDQSEINKTVELDDLLKTRIEEALKEAIGRGYRKSNINSFLAGLSVLPPPVPIEEYAIAQGMNVSEIESFVSDLAPLLEKTKHGIWFRDEPTETLIRKDYASNEQALNKVSKNLFIQQDSSVYAAQALPGLLKKRGDGKKLFELAFDERFPKEITSTVGKQVIRHARLKAAISYASQKENYNQLVRLLVELSTIEALNQRGSDYILNNPDLIVASHDVDATRRLFELRTSWQGTRHARIAIAHILSDEASEAYRHGIRANEWINHFSEQDDTYRRDKGGYESVDIASIPLCVLSQGKNEVAINWMKKWKDWYAYEVSEHLFSFIDTCNLLSSCLEIDTNKLFESLTDEIGVIAGTLSFQELTNDKQQVELIKKLSEACNKRETLELGRDDYHRNRSYTIQDGLFKASVIALSMGLKSEGLSICGPLKSPAPSLWSFSDRFSDHFIIPYILRQVTISVAKDYKLSAQDLLPRELVEIWSVPDRNLDDKEFEIQLKQKIAERFERSEKEKTKKEARQSFSYETKRDAERFLNERLEPIVKLSKSLAELLSSPIGNADSAFVNLVQTWSDARKTKSVYDVSEDFNMFFDRLGRELIVFSLWARTDLSLPSIKTFWKILSEGGFFGAHSLIRIVSVLSKQTKFHELAGEIAVKANTMIEQEDDVNHRASLYAKLSRAILPASLEETACYFKAGLDQMDIIGSGDYEFTNELLLFAASLKGKELKDKDFHTLTNICELNMGEETHKFPWYAFAQGLSKIAGCKGLAKLSRWDDRNKVRLEDTLLPYLIALVKNNKIEADIGLSLLRLCDPSEAYGYGISHLAEAIYNKSCSNQKALIRELLVQFEENNSGIVMDTEAERLYEISSKVLGRGNEETMRILALRNKSNEVREQRNEHMNYRGKVGQKDKKRKEGRESENTNFVKKLINETDPIDEASISKSIDKLNEMQAIYLLEQDYFSGIRAKVGFSDRSRYIQIISKLEHLFYYRKIEELRACKDTWSQSSKALDTSFFDLDNVLLQLHSDELISFDRLSTSDLKEISELCGVSITTIAMKLIETFSGPDIYVPASVWLSLASIICERSDVGEGQIALVRLLNSNAAKLSLNVEDGEWEKDMYPSGSSTEIAAGLVWQKLGSPLTADRWRAAHSVRRFAKLKRWDVIDILIAKIGSDNARPFQAPELTFYQLHARLWLLISLARVAIDYPIELNKYADIFKKMALDKSFPHVLIQHFSAKIVQTCAEKGNLKLPAKEKKNIDSVNKSPYPRLKEKNRKFRRGGLYETRPDDAPEPQSKFSLDYDFQKYDVQFLSDVFGKHGWEMNDLIAKWVRKFDDSIDGMYENGGRERSFGRRQTMGITSKYHTYGQQLGWNSLFLTAGELLAECPVTDDAYDEDPWPYWTNRKLLTRNDGLWLSDGVDARPLDTMINLFEKGEKELVITGNKDTILSLIGVNSLKIENDIIVEGNWCSSDGIRVRVSSALVPSDQAKTLATQLSKEDPFRAWVPRYQEGEDEEEYMRSQKGIYEPWLVCPSVETKIDENDTLGVRCVMERTHFKKEITETFSLKTDDSFKRQWKNDIGNIQAIAEAWGYTGEHDEETSESGLRFKCSKEFLQSVLSPKNMDLLVHIKLERYEQSTGHRDSRYTHTTAVVTITADLNIKFYKGFVNHLYVNKW
ncbi:MAG: hypothetical protein NPIRA01_09760 [Nitrospirales bacterium]|nr:MAG: hypothetical protein NPIRA01_09760 [Nitrospirales bacterium]